ncbi:MAG: TonB-dependent receptor plug domain-containing protein [Bacteroidetes bacterium]|nr:TonB-dependent receptor plug domain-containing protein [Bacteroidota bacterium]
MGKHNIEISDLETLPVLLGEPDVQKILQLLPGVQGGREGNSGLYVRGGRADQNLILLDGLPLYNPSHLLGFFSMFPAQAMKNVQFYKGGFPARYGGRLSSVIDYTMKEGNLKRYRGQVAAGILSSRVLIEGPIKRDKASFLLSGRRTLIDLLLLAIEDREAERDFVFFL